MNERPRCITVRFSREIEVEFPLSLKFDGCDFVVFVNVLPLSEIRTK